MIISKRKNALDILKETKILNAKYVYTPMDLSIKLVANQESYSDHGRFKR